MNGNARLDKTCSAASPPRCSRARSASTSQVAATPVPLSSASASPQPHPRPATAVPDAFYHNPRFYSDRHQVPRIDSLWELYPGQAEREDDEDEDEDEDEERDKDANSGELVNSNVQSGTRCREVRRRNKVERHSKLVTDPITGQEVKVCDAKYDPPSEAPATRREEFPPDSWVNFVQELKWQVLWLVTFVVGTFILLNGVLGMQYSYSVLVVLGGALSWWRKIDSAWEDFVHFEESQHSKQRLRVEGEGRESTEWLNNILARFWPQINSEIFASGVDLLEDVMQASIPSIITQIKIVNIDQGFVPMRILSMRWLEAGTEAVEEMKESGGEVPRLLEDLQAGGEYVNLEVAFSYRAAPSSASVASKAKNANLLVHFFAGLNGFYDAPIPVWVELRGVTGVCRLKVQLIPDPPFIKLVTFTLMGMPKIEIAAVPLNQRFLNVMNLPIISDFINSSIRATAKQFVAPSNYTLDLSKLLIGDDAKRELHAVGVVVVHVMSAHSVRAADINGKSDCYATLSFSKTRKPLWSTRIIFEDLNPVWDETAVIMVTDDELKAAEKLRADVYDSDRWTADDVLGRTEFELATLVANPGRRWDLEDNMMGLGEGTEYPGTLKWSVVYYPKRPLDLHRATSGRDPMPDGLEALQPIPKVLKADSEAETSARFVPPDPEYKSGLLSIQIHNIIGLEKHALRGSKSSGIGSHNNQIHMLEEEEEGENLPSSYCSVILNNQKIYRTRTKPLTSKPFFNAEIERFVRNWETTTLLVVVRDSRQRELNPILGVVDLRLKDLFVNRSQISRFFPIRGGIGYGKIRISLLFRSVDVRLPPTLLAADIATVEIRSKPISSSSLTDPDVKAADLISFITPLSKAKAVRSSHQDGWALDQSFTFGVRYRHSVPLVLFFRSQSRLRRSKTLAIGIVWLKDVPDDAELALDVPIFTTSSPDRFVQNCGTHPDATPVGTISLPIYICGGLTHSHRRAAQREKDFADVLEAVECLGQLTGKGGVSEDDDEGEESSEDEKKGKRTKKEERKQLHRMEHGAMQYKGARTLKWVGMGVKRRVVGGVRERLRMEPRRETVGSEV